MAPSKSTTNTADVKGTFFDVTACNIAPHILRERTIYRLLGYKATSLYRRKQVMGE
jgi:hypothetical protein